MRFELRVRQEAGLAEFTAMLRRGGVLLEGDDESGRWLIQAKTAEEARLWADRLPTPVVTCEEIADRTA